MVDWKTAHVTIPKTARRFIIEAVRGGYEAAQDDGDICVDGFEVTINQCPSG